VNSAYANLRTLVRFAAIGGADPSWLDEISREIAELLLSIDPRRLETAELRRRVQAAERKLIRNGVTTGLMKQLRMQFPQFSRQYLYELRKVSCDSVDTSVV
jgi:hypothetical protein